MNDIIPWKWLIIRDDSEAFKYTIGTYLTYLYGSQKTYHYESFYNRIYVSFTLAYIIIKYPIQVENKQITWQTHRTWGWLLKVTYEWHTCSGHNILQILLKNKSRLVLTVKTGNRWTSSTFNIKIPIKYNQLAHIYFDWDCIYFKQETFDVQENLSNNTQV